MHILQYIPIGLALAAFALRFYVLSKIGSEQNNLGI